MRNLENREQLFLAGHFDRAAWKHAWLDRFVDADLISNRSRRPWNACLSPPIAAVICVRRLIMHLGDLRAANSGPCRTFGIRSVICEVEEHLESSADGIRFRI